MIPEILPNCTTTLFFFFFICSMFYFFICSNREKKKKGLHQVHVDFEISVANTEDCEDCSVKRCLGFA